MAVEIQYYFALVSGVQRSGYTVLHSIKWFPAISVLNWPIYCNDVIGCFVICTLHPRDCSIATDLHSLVPPPLSSSHPPSGRPQSVLCIYTDSFLCALPSHSAPRERSLTDLPAEVSWEKWNTDPFLPEELG